MNHPNSRQIIHNHNPHDPAANNSAASNNTQMPTAAEMERILAHCRAPALKDGGRIMIQNHTLAPLMEQYPEISIRNDMQYHNRPNQSVPLANATTTQSAYHANNRFKRESTWVSRYNRSVARQFNTSSPTSTNNESANAVNAYNNAESLKSKLGNDVKKRKASQIEKSTNVASSKKLNSTKESTSFESSNEVNNNNNNNSDRKTKDKNNVSGSTSIFPLDKESKLPASSATHDVPGATTNTAPEKGTNSTTTSKATKPSKPATANPPWYEPTHTYSKQFPTLNNLSLNLMDRSSILGRIHMENTLREIVNYTKHTNEELIYDTGRSKRAVVSIPIVKDSKAFYKKAKTDRWIENMLRLSMCCNIGNNINNGNNNEEDVVGCIVEYLAKRHRKAFVNSLEGLNLVIPSPSVGKSKKKKIGEEQVNKVSTTNTHKTNEEKDEKAESIRKKLSQKKMENSYTNMDEPLDSLDNI